MGDLFATFGTALAGIAIFLLVLLGIYFVTGFLPGRGKERGRVAVFLGPALLFLLIGLLIPAIRTIVISLYTNKGDALDVNKFVGLSNYRKIFGDKATRMVLLNNLWWVILGTGFSVGVGLAVARIADQMKGERVWKSLIFLPTAISMVGAGIIWRFVYNKSPDPSHEFGLLNAVFDKVGASPRIWLLQQQNYVAGAPHLNTILLIVVFVWIQAGFCTTVLSAAVKGVPDSLKEAASIDGATDLQAFRKVTIPYIMPTIVAVSTTTIIAVLKVFDIIQSMTGGNFNTDVLANEMYDKTYPQNQPGYGAALAVIIFVVVIPVVIVNLRSQRRARELA